MKIWNKFLVLFIVCLIITTAAPVQIDYVTLTVEAHQGRTDKNGGHKDNKNVSGLGSYHYHCGGNPAHLHENGVCPYAGSTGATSTGATSSAKTNSKQTTVETPAASKSTTQSNSSKQTVAAEKKVTESAVTISDTSYDNVAFNASYYASNYTDVYELYGDDAKALYNHFITVGIKEGRQSSAQFSILVYKENNQDLQDSFGDDLIKYYNHYIEYGVNESRVAK